MGEKIKNLDSLRGIFDIELNKATYPGGPRYIHIQNPNFRYCVNETEFIQIAVAIKKGCKILRHNKGMEEEK